MELLSDGAHIALLIMVALQYFAPQFIKEGRLCWLRSPLYIVQNGKQNSYYFNDEEFNKVRKSIKGEVTRAKGLGELEDQIARESMFSKEFQRMDQLIPDEDTLGLLLNLMGKDSEPKRDFIFKNIDFSEIKE